MFNVNYKIAHITLLADDEQHMRSFYRALILKNLLTLKVKIILDGDDLHLFWIYSKIGSET